MDQEDDGNCIELALHITHRSGISDGASQNIFPSLAGCPTFSRPTLFTVPLDLYPFWEASLPSVELGTHEEGSFSHFLKTFA